LLAWIGFTGRVHAANVADRAEVELTFHVENKRCEQYFVLSSIDAALDWKPKVHPDTVVVVIAAAWLGRAGGQSEVLDAPPPSSGGRELGWTYGIGRSEAYLSQAGLEVGVRLQLALVVESRVPMGLAGSPAHGR